MDYKIALKLVENSTSTCSLLNERTKQILNGKDRSFDTEINSFGQLPYMAKKLLTQDRQEITLIPLKNWDFETEIKLMSKTYKERLIIAASFCLAEYDRLVYVEYLKNKEAESGKE